jgi:hypothetical protein
MSASAPDPDPLLPRVERNTLIVCGLAAMLAAIGSRAHLAAALGVLGGGAIAAVSYVGIKAGADVLVARRGAGGGSRRRVLAGLVKSFTRYGILASAAYVLMARVRLPPLAVVAGALSVVVAIAIEALSEVAQQRRR